MNCTLIVNPEHLLCVEEFVAEVRDLCVQCRHSSQSVDVDILSRFEPNVKGLANILLQHDCEQDAETFSEHTFVEKLTDIFLANPDGPRGLYVSTVRLTPITAEIIYIR